MYINVVYYLRIFLSDEAFLFLALRKKKTYSNTFLTNIYNSVSKSFYCFLLFKVHVCVPYNIILSVIYPYTRALLLFIILFILKIEFNIPTGLFLPQIIFLVSIIEVPSSSVNDPK